VAGRPHAHPTNTPSWALLPDVRPRCVECDRGPATRRVCVLDWCAEQTWRDTRLCEGCADRYLKFGWFVVTIDTEV